jgi:hypothetical protein
MVSGVCSGLSLHLLVLAASGCEVGFVLGPSFVRGWFLIPTTTGAHDVPSCKYFCIPNVDLLRGTDGDATCLRIVSTVLNLLEECLNRLLGVPCPAHVFEADLQVDCCDVAVGFEEVVQRVLLRCWRSPPCCRSRYPSTLARIH